jgi:hypothetical protein
MVIVDVPDTAAAVVYGQGKTTPEMTLETMAENMQRTGSRNL